uniref:Uncharacterized protein n=1 Tax=Latimeria chalumnae TaxID=7897 RepID=H3BI75_LATCH
LMRLGICNLLAMINLIFDSQRRAKDEDPIIPFSDGPIISKWGAISRSSRTGYHTTDPVQATASQGSATKPISVAGKYFIITSCMHTSILYARTLPAVVLVILSVPFLYKS